jgi:sulfur carrier protein ThiS
MRIKLLPIGLIRTFAKEGEIEVEEGLTPRRLISDLRIPRELKMISFVNGTRIDLDHELHEGDDLKLVTLAMGG